MKSRRRPLLAGVSLSIALVLALAGEHAARADGSISKVVAVLAPHESRLADEIRRELESSKFEVLSADLGGRPWQDVARVVDGGRLLRGVAVEPSDRTLTVYTRPLGAHEVDVRLVLSVDPADRMARRHACLSVVEFLHALSESDPGAAAEGGRPSAPRGAARAGSAAPGPASGGVAASPPPTTVQATGGVPPAGTPPPLPRASNWQLGVGTTFDLETGAGEPTSHLQFLARFPLGQHLSLCGRILWPLLAAQYRTGDSDIRSWTFVTSASLQYALAPSHRLRPYFGLALGARLGLAENTPLSAPQSGQSLSISGTFGIEVGVRYSIRPLLEVFFQLEAARSWLIPPPDKGDVPIDNAGDGEAARASIGITFES